MPKVDLAKAMDMRKSSTNNSAAVDKSYNDLFGLPSENETAVLLPISKLIHYSRDPFKDRPGEENDSLAASIREIGLQFPIIVRPGTEKGFYEILAGRRRTAAVKANGGTEIAALIRDVNDDKAVMIATETNLRYREKILHSEKAFAYKLQLDTIKRQGKRTDLKEDGSSTQPAWKSESAVIIAERNETTKDEIRRYIRLTFLIPPLLELADSEKIPFMAAVELSYLDETAQNTVFRFFFENEYGTKLDVKLATALHAEFKEKTMLTDESIEKICSNRQAATQPRILSINRRKLVKYIDDVASLPSDKELEQLFFEFIKLRFGKKVS